MLRRAPEADALLAETWGAMTQPRAIVTPAVAFLALLSAGLRGRSPTDPLGRLKTLLLGPALPRDAGIPHIWRAGTEVAALSQDLPEDWRDLPQALLAVLDRFPLWRDTEPVPMDAKWPSEEGPGRA